MLNNTNLRIARHYGAFGDGFCACKDCKAKRQREMWINDVVMVVILVTLALVVLFFVPSNAEAQTLQASWYSNASLKSEGTWKTSNGIMANGRVFDENALTCATRLYPLGTRLLITNKLNNKSVLVVVTDRIGKRFAKTRIDLSKGAFLRLGSLKAGLIPIKVDKVVIKVKKG
jgi:rare lipoprotein A